MILIHPLPSPSDHHHHHHHQHHHWPCHHQDEKTPPKGTHHPEIPGYADLDQQQGDLLTSFGSIDMAGLANHTSDFIGGFFGENDENDEKNGDENHCSVLPHSHIFKKNLGG